MNVRPFACVILTLASLLCFLPLKPSFSQTGAEVPAAFLDRQDVFPVGVWLQDPENARAYQSIGINFYAGLWEGPTVAQLEQLQAARMPVFAPQNDIGRSGRYRDIIAGWIMPDEPDNAQAKDGGGFGPPIPPVELLTLYRKMKERDPDRPILLNLGQGVAWDQWYGRGTRTNHPEDYKEYVRAGDILSFDIYPVTHRDAGVRGRLDFVARGVDRLIGLTGGAKPVWAVIEASRVSNPKLLPTGDEVRKLVWLSIIHGARGIIYFVHQFSPRFIEASLLGNRALSADVAAINRRLQSLARVLKSDSLPGTLHIETDATAPSGSISAIVKKDDCHLYVFAGSVSKFAASVRLVLTGEAVMPQVEVLDEDRTLPLEKGAFRDAFEPYAVHLYKIPRSGTKNCH